MLRLHFARRCTWPRRLTCATRVEPAAERRQALGCTRPGRPACATLPAGVAAPVVGAAVPAASAAVPAGSALALILALLPALAAAAEPGAEPALAAAGLYHSLLWALVLLFGAGQAALVYGILRGRRRAAVAGQYGGGAAAEIAWSVVPALLVVVVFAQTFRRIDGTRRAPAAESDLAVEVVGRQWWWEIRYPALGVVTATDLHVPVGRTVQIVLSAADVPHALALPPFERPREVRPGEPPQPALRFVAERPGVYEGGCVRPGSAAHPRMPIRIVAEPPGVFTAWVEQQRTPRSPLPPPDASIAAARGHRLVTTGPCVDCHRIAGVPTMVGEIGPNLTHVASRQQVAGTLPMSAESLALWLSNPRRVKVGVRMPDLGLPPEDIRDIVEYLVTLK